MESNKEPGKTLDVQMKYAQKYGDDTLLHHRAIQSGFGRDSITLFMMSFAMVGLVGTGGRLSGSGGGVGG